MANKIQIKRSTANATVTGLANGELAFTQASNTLHIGLPDGSGTLRIGGAQYPGTLTNSHALVANATGYIDEVRVANAVIDKIYANGSHGSAGSILAVDNAGEIYWAGAVTADPAGSNTQIQFNDSEILGASADFTFDKTSNTLSVSNAVLSGNVASSNTTTGTLKVTGGVGVTGRINVIDIAVGNDSVYSTINSTSFTGTANNATYAYGKTEGNLNVNSALTSNNSTYAFGKTEGNLNVNSALTSNNSTYAFGKSEGDLNVNSALTSNNSTYAFGKSESALNVNNAVTANDASYLGGTAAAGYAKLAGNQIFTGNNTFNARLIVNGAFVANGSTGVAGQILTSNGSSIYWTDQTTVSNVAANSLTSNAVTINDTIVIGNTTVNVFANSTTVSISNPTSSVSLNSSAFSGTANNATYAYGKSESALNVNSALTSNNSTYAFGKTEGNLNVNSALTANLASYVTANDGIVSNSSGVFVKAGTGVTVNATGVHIGQPVGTTDNVTFNDVIINGNAALGSSTSDRVSINGLVNTDIIPSANVTYSLGNTTNRWNDLYLSGSTIYLGNAAISEAGDGGVSVGNLNITTTADIADLTVTGNTKLGNNTSADVVSFISTVNTNIIPSANITYDLGGIDQRWRAVYANTINATAGYIAGDLQVGGNVYVTGNVTSLNVQTLSINDPLIHLAANNEASDLLDIGFIGHYSDDAGTTKRHTGLFRDASDAGVYKLFTNLVQADLDTGTATTINTAAASFAINTLVAYLNSGGLVSNSTAVTITANSTVAVSITANTLTLSSPLAGTSGGTGLGSYTAEDILVANSSNGFRKLGIGSSGYVLQSNGSALVYDTLDGGTF